MLFHPPNVFYLSDDVSALQVSSKGIEKKSVSGVV